MATFGPKPRDNASEYEGIYFNPENRFGVQNSRATPGSRSRALTSRLSEDGRRKRMAPIYQGPVATQGTPARDSASLYRQEMDDTPERRFGVQNVRAVGSSRSQTLTSRPSEDGRRKRMAPVYRGPMESTNTELQSSKNEQVANRYYNDPQVENAPESQKSKKVKISVFARARGVTFGIVTFSWVLWWFFIWQLPIAAVGAAMLGLATQIETSYLLSAVNTATQAVGSLFGYEYTDIEGLGMLCVVTAAFFGVMSTCVAGFTAVLWRLKPLSGNKAGTKMATFIVGIVGSAIPFINMFPWVIFWILIMMRYPK